MSKRGVLNVNTVADKATRDVLVRLLENVEALRAELERMRKKVELIERRNAL